MKRVVLFEVLFLTIFTEFWVPLGIQFGVILVRAGVRTGDAFRLFWFLFWWDANPVLDTDTEHGVILFGSEAELRRVPFHSDFSDGTRPSRPA